MELARTLGFKACKTEATGEFSRRAFLRAGFLSVGECGYSEYPVLQGIRNHQGVTLLVKILD